MVSAAVGLHARTHERSSYHSEWLFLESSFDSYIYTPCAQQVDTTTLRFYYMLIYFYTRHGRRRRSSYLPIMSRRTRCDRPRGQGLPMWLSGMSNSQTRRHCANSSNTFIYTYKHINIYTYIRIYVGLLVVPPSNSRKTQREMPRVPYPL